MAFSGLPRPRATVLPIAPGRYEQAWMQRALDMIAKETDASLKTREAAPYVLLLSPSAKVFKVTVSDAGVISAVEMLQGDSTA